MSRIFGFKTNFFSKIWKSIIGFSPKTFLTCATKSRTLLDSLTISFLIMLVVFINQSTLFDQLSPIEQSVDVMEEVLLPSGYIVD